MAPSTVQRLRPSALTRRHATWPSGNSSSWPRRKKRPSTLNASAPSRTASPEERSPTSSLMAESSADLPAPVSPVSTVSPSAGESEASQMSARLRTCSSSIMAAPYRHAP